MHHPFHPLRALLVIPLLAAPLCTADPGKPAPAAPARPIPADAEKSAPAAPPTVRELPDGTFLIGDVSVNPKSREIRIPVTASSPNRTLEYILTTDAGKAYETLLITRCTPIQVNTALLMLHYRKSDELFPIPNRDPDAPLRYPVVAPEIRAAARFRMHAEWQADGKPRTAPLHELIQFEPTGKSLPDTHWVYNGSYFDRNNAFVAQSCGDIISLMKDRNTLANYPNPDGDEEGWIPFPKRFPAPGTPLTLILTPDTTESKHP